MTHLTRLARCGLYCKRACVAKKTSSRSTSHVTRVNELCRACVNASYHSYKRRNHRMDSVASGVCCQKDEFVQYESCRTCDLCRTCVNESCHSYKLCIHRMDSVATSGCCQKVEFAKFDSCHTCESVMSHMCECIMSLI